MHHHAYKWMNSILSLLHKRGIRFLLGALIILGIIITTLSSYEELAPFFLLFNIISFLTGFVFTIEWLLRLISAPALYKYQSFLKCRLKYLCSFMGIIDFISILPFTVPYLFSDNHLISISLEFGRIVLIFKLFRYSESYKTICEILSTIKYELLTSFSFIAIIVSFSAVIMYYIERDAQPDKFTDIGEGFWWAIISFTTVGYGDGYPITGLGKLIAGSMDVVGRIIFASPTALGRGAYMKYLKEKNQKHKTYK